MDFAKTDGPRLEPDKKLAVIVGDAPRCRSEIIRKFWDYINEKGLQDTDRRLINADRDMQQVLGGKKQVNIFQVTTLVSKHLKKPGKKARKKAPKKAARKAPAKKAAKKAPKKAAKKAPKKASRK